MNKLTDKIIAGDIDPSYIIAHTLPLDEATEAYEIFREKHDGCIKEVLKPWRLSDFS